MSAGGGVGTAGGGVDRLQRTGGARGHGRVPAGRRGAIAAGANRHPPAPAGPARPAAPHRLRARACARLGPAAPLPRRYATSTTHLFSYTKRRAEAYGF